MNTSQAVPARVLLVEDDDMLTTFFMRALRRAGHSVEAHARGDDGLRAALAEAFDVLVLDWRLPGVDGIEIVRAVRSAGSGARVLMLTGNGEGMRGEAMAAGVDAFLGKPCGLSELTGAVAMLAGESRVASRESCAA